MRIDELKNRDLVKFTVNVNGIHGFFVLCNGCWCFCLTALLAKHFARSFSTNLSNLGKYTFALSSPFVLTNSQENTCARVSF